MMQSITPLQKLEVLNTVIVSISMLESFNRDNKISINEKTRKTFTKTLLQKKYYLI
jgi:hypothetical protein